MGVIFLQCRMFLKYYIYFFSQHSKLLQLAQQRWFQSFKQGLKNLPFFSSLLSSYETFSWQSVVVYLSAKKAGKQRKAIDD